MIKKQDLYLLGLIVMSGCMTILEVLMNLKEQVVSDSTQAVWGTVFLVASILWAYYDADREDFEKPFDFGLFIYIFWPVAFPWYLVKTRGAEGALIFLGFISIWLGPWLAGLVAYVYYT